MKTNWETGIDMRPCTRRTTVIALIICMALPAWGQQYLLYAPQPVPSGQKASSQDGILVQEIEIQKGDTLYALSRKFSGHGMYFPQILLFNSIKNPNLIYPGNTLRIPATQKEGPNLEHNDKNQPVHLANPKPPETKKRQSKQKHSPLSGNRQGLHRFQTQVPSSL